MAKLPGGATSNTIAFSRTDAAHADEPAGAPQPPAKRKATARKRLPRWASDAVLSLAHELRNPMQSALGFSQLLLTSSDTGSLTTEQHSYLHRIIDAVQQMESVIRFMTEPVLTPAQLHYQPVVAGEIIRDAIEQSMLQAQQRDIRLIIDVPPRLPKAQLDRERVLQILINLLNNAVKFAPAQSTVTVGARHKQETANIEFFVHDEGVGVPKRYQQAIFHPFVQVPKRQRGKKSGLGSGKPPGQGIGLAIVDQLVALHGGRVWVESAPRQGCTFWVSLPLSPPTETES